MAKGDRDGIALRAHTQKDGRVIQYARYSIPEKVKGGKVEWRRVERSTRTAERCKALQIAKADKEAAFKCAFSGEQVASGRTFAEAALPYIKATGPKTHLTPILYAIGRVQLDLIDTDFISGLAAELYPGRSPATWNRQVYTPIIAIIRSAETKDWKPPTFKRPKGWLADTNWKKPPRNWWTKVTASAPANLAALVLFMRLHGRRIGEACAITPDDIDRKTWTVTIRDTKVGQNIQLRLAQPVIDQLLRYEWWEEKRVFGYQHRWSVYKPLRAACEAAGVPYHVPKDTGRHEFASHLLRSGRTLKQVAEAGRWKSTAMPARIYGHLEQNDVDDDARALGEAWHREQEERGDVRPLTKRKEKGK